MATRTAIERLWTVEDLAEFLGKSVHTVRHDATRAPHRLPPRVNLPDTALLRWQPRIVLSWVDSFQSDYSPQRRRGRPRKPLGDEP